MNKKVVALAMIAIGAVMMAYTGFQFVTTEKIIEIGPLNVSKDNNHVVQWSPIAGGVLLVGGIILLLVNKPRS